VTVNANAPSQGTPLWEELLLWFGLALLFGGLLAWWMRSGGAGAPGGWAARAWASPRPAGYDPSSAKHTTFADVAGIDVAGDELAGGNLRQLAIAPHSGLEDRHLLQGGDGRGGLALLLQALPPH
jgi:hypothetical protein